MTRRDKNFDQVAWRMSKNNERSMAHFKYDPTGGFGCPTGKGYFTSSSRAEKYINIHCPAAPIPALGFRLRPFEGGKLPNSSDASQSSGFFGAIGSLWSVATAAFDGIWGTIWTKER